MLKLRQLSKPEGVQFPIHLDMPVDQTNTTKVQRVQSLKQSLEATLGTDNVVIDIQQLQKDEVLNVTYFAETAAEKIGISQTKLDVSRLH